MYQIKRIAAFAAVWTIILLTACGGGGVDPDQSTPPIAARVPSILEANDAASRGVLDFPNETGVARTRSTDGPIDHSNLFFKPLGNGRSCSSCHQPSDGWSITPSGLQARFDATQGTDAVFKLVDGANSPLAPVATLDQRRAAYSMLLTKGLIRVGMPLPTNAEFALVAVDDPYGYASANEFSLFRRPLPTTNLKFLSTFMWDARETLVDSTDPTKHCVPSPGPMVCYESETLDLMDQANSAVRGHAQAAADLTKAQQHSIVDFETTLYTAQITDTNAGDLTADGASGGPVALSHNIFHFGINDAFFGDYKTHAAFDPSAMTLFERWSTVKPRGSVTDVMLQARQAIARGEKLFNSKPINIVGVNGINDALNKPVLKGTCTTCHDTPNSGTHSIPLLVNLGLADVARRTPDMPLYTLKNNNTGEIIKTMDPGLAMKTGKWADVGRMKVPSLRAIESRSPYFQNGSESDLSSLVRFYDTRFGIGFTPDEVRDVVAFLRAL